MKFNIIYLILGVTICFVTKSFSQKGDYDIVNGIALFGGVTKVDLNTKNFITKQGDGFIIGTNATVDIPHKFYNMSFGIQLSETPISILARPTTISTTHVFIDYKVFAAQLALMGHIKLAGPYLTLDIGPMLQYNSPLELENKNQEGYFINNYDNLTAKAISNISQFNLNGAVGITGGFKFLKLRAHYIYSVTNTLKKLESENIDASGGNSRFKGHFSMLVFGAMISF